jgi:ribose transport system ATP-binding protein
VNQRFERSTTALEVRNLTKRFAGETALDGVDFSILPGEVHGLLGQNGSGKSTLIKLLAGFHAPEPGASLTVHGETVSLPLSPADPRRLGIAFVHQHLGLLPSLTVLENLRLSQFSTERKLFLNWRAERRSAEHLFSRFGLNIDPSVTVSSLSQTERAMLAIVRAFEDLHASERGASHGIMILDEPTPFLPRAGVQQLFELIHSITAEGASVIFVSHDIDEICEITDRATVLRDGAVAGVVETAETAHEEFVELIVGRKVERFRMRRSQEFDAATAFKVTNLGGRIARDVNLEVKTGEVVGLTGLIGSGFDEVPYLLFGAAGERTGSIEASDWTMSAKDMTPTDAIRRGFALLPSDRLERSGVGRLSVMENQTLPVLEDFFSAFRLDWGAMRKRSRELNELLDVRPKLRGLPDMELSSLSGGNQQKALLAKWLQQRPALLLLDEPTQGVDVGARQTLLEQLGKASSQGTSILCASTDAEQLAQICDRVLVFARGRIVSELVGDDVSKETITERCLMSSALASRSRATELIQ